MSSDGRRQRLVAFAVALLTAIHTSVEWEQLAKLVQGRDANVSGTLERGRMHLSGRETESHFCLVKSDGNRKVHVQTDMYNSSARLTGHSDINRHRAELHVGENRDGWFGV